MPANIIAEIEIRNIVKKKKKKNITMADDGQISGTVTGIPL